MKDLPDKYVIVKYLRLSLEDGDNAESDSISNQRELLDLHISMVFAGKDVKVIELVDDGYTGTNMKRPGMQKLLILAEAQQINCVIVKDFSRFARDYIEVGRYTDLIFPDWQIRFISANDDYDSNDYLGSTGGIEVAMKNLSNAMYSQDLSEKIKSVKHLQQRNGDFISCYAIYGYLKSPEDMHKLIIDPNVAPVVKRIFEMRDNGVSYSIIAKTLNDEGVLSPSEYKRQFLGVKQNWTGFEKKALWGKSTLVKIINDERYTGKMVCGHTRAIYVGSKGKRVPKEEYVITENTHEAIVSQELFNRVRSESKIPSTKATRPKRLLSGLVRCAGCKRTMLPYGTFPHAVRYRCERRLIAHEENCCKESYAEQELNAVVEQAVMVEFKKAKMLLNKQEKINMQLKKFEREIQQINKRITGYKQRKVDAYIKLTKGEIAENEFFERKEKIEKQISECNEELKLYDVKGLSASDKNTLTLFEDFEDSTELTNELLKKLIKNIYLYDDMRIVIEWNYKERVESYAG